MAKKEEEKVMTVEEKLRALYELQTVDSKIDELRILAGELPQEVKDMSDEVEGLKYTVRQNAVGTANVSGCQTHGFFG